MGEFKVLGRADGSGAFKELDRASGSGAWKTLEWEGVSIDVGSDYVNRTYDCTEGYTWIDLNNPANADGTLTKLSLYVSAAMSAGFKVGVFERISTSTFKCKSVCIVGVIGTGEQKNISISLAILTGEYIGYYESGNGRLDAAVNGHGGRYYKSGDHCVVNSQQSYSLGAFDCISIYGTSYSV